MDAKAVHIFEHYKRTIENNQFDEYDIWGFLIFIRSYLNKSQYPGIFEFCDLIAHRNRDRGIVMKCIENAIANNYKTLPNSRIIKDYHGITKEQWEYEWSQFSNQYGVGISTQTLAEIMLCIFSLAQYTEYSSVNGAGKIVMIQGKEGTISLATTEGTPHSLYICFSQFSPYHYFYEYTAGIITDVVETRRVGRELQLYAEKKRII